MNNIDIKSIRKKYGISQDELSKRLGIANCTLCHYESGKRKITLEMFLKLISVCNKEIKLVDKKSS